MNQSGLADMPAANMQANYTWPKNPMADTQSILGRYASRHPLDITFVWCQGDTPDFK